MKEWRRKRKEEVETRKIKMRKKKRSERVTHTKKRKENRTYRQGALK